MNIAEHALKVARSAVVGVSANAQRRPKKSVREIIERNRDVLMEWTDKGMPASLMSPRLEVSNTSFWQHAPSVLSAEYIHKLKANGEKANRDNSYKERIIASLL